MQKYSQGGGSHRVHAKKFSGFRNLFGAGRKEILWNVVLLTGVLFMFGLLVFGALFVVYGRDLPNPNSLVAREVSQSTKIYDRTGEHLLYEVAPDEKRTLITIDQIPDVMRKATISAEDRDFYTHNGFSIRGLMRGSLRYVASFGRLKQSGSTITQQLVKNAVLTSEKSLSRKVKEIILSIAIEQRFSKDQILQMYLNEIGYGGVNYGVEAAAQTYFGKSVSDVTLAEAATLAGLPNRPSVLLQNPDLLKERRDWILDGMVEEGYVSAEDAEKAKAEPIALKQIVSSIEAPHFVLWVRSQLEEEYGTAAVERGGLRVLTTLDYDKQMAAEEAVKKGVETAGPRYGFKNGGLVSLDPKTGEVLAMVGSPDYNNDEIAGQVNVTLRPLQPGSSIKPLVYAAAFEKGYTPNTILWDVATNFGGANGGYEPQNYNGSFNGPVTIRKALQGSLNIPAVKMLYLVGLDDAEAFMKKLGYTTDIDTKRVGLTMVLGGAEVTPIEHARAYATLANGGVRHDIAPVLKIEDSSGTVLFEKKNDEGTRVIDGNIAAMTSDVLSDNASRQYIFGSLSSNLTLSDRPVAVKTGTTNSNKDAWTAGYTPSVVAVVWVGNANGTLMKSGADGSVVAAPIWKQYMTAAVKGTPSEGFPVAEIPTRNKPMFDGRLPGNTITIDTATGKLATDKTPERFREERFCGEYHDILYYVDRNDPLGPAPINPERDPQFASWEGAVQRFVNGGSGGNMSGFAPCTPPEGQDDIHTSENAPTLEVLSPVAGDRLGRSFELRTNVSARYNFDRLEIDLDGAHITTLRSATGGSITLPSWADEGAHRLTVTALDEFDNSTSVTVSITIGAPGAVSSARIVSPGSGEEIRKTKPTYDISVDVPNASSLDAVRVRVTSLWTGASEVIYDAKPSSGIIGVKWQLPEPGVYQIVAATVKGGVSAESAPVTVRVRNARNDGTSLESFVLPVEESPVTVQ